MTKPPRQTGPGGTSSDPPPKNIGGGIDLRPDPISNSRSSEELAGQSTGRDGGGRGRASQPGSVEKRMKRRLIEYLGCPECGGDLHLVAKPEEQEEIEEGRLVCGACREDYPIHRGIPRFVRFEEGDERAQTARNFGEQWQVFDHVADHHRQQFLDWLAPVDPSFALSLWGRV